GRPVNTGYFGEADLSGIPLHRIEKIQVTRGPSSLAYGAGTLGGVVNIITRGGRNQPLQATLKSDWGSGNYRRNILSFGGAKNSWYNWISLEEKHRDSFPLSSAIDTTYYENGGTRDNSAYQNYGLHFKSGKNWQNGSEVNFTGNVSGGEKGVPGSIYEKQNWRFYDIFRNGAQAGCLFPLSEELTLTGALFSNSYKDRLINYQDRTYDIHNIYFNSVVENTTTGGDVQLQVTGFQSHNLRTGLKQKSDFTVRKELTIPGDRSTYSTSLYSGYIEDAWQVSNAVNLVAGMGIHLFDKGFDNDISAFPSPMAGIASHWNNGVTTRLNLKRSVFFPTQHNLYSSSRGNPDLKPEEALMTELSLEKPVMIERLGYFHPKIVVFLNNTVNMIEMDNTGYFANIAEVQTSGGEISLDYFYSENISLTLSSSLLDWKLNDNRELYETPHWTSGLSLKIASSLFGMISPELLLYGSHQTRNLLGAIKQQESYTLLNLIYSLPIKQFAEFRIIGRNLLDSDYQERYGYPGPGRWFSGGLTLSFRKSG
ncbi:TonB-dependent receptor plug domain-containing protein, partial [Calditrichota bacterium]